MNIGFCWAGAPSHRRDAYRSIPLPLWWPLVSRPGTQWYSLVVGSQAGALEGLRIPNVHTWDGTPTFAETALRIRSCHLVITVDTVILHLAGTIGVETWGLLPRWGDFRWGDDGETTPWYPSVRLFRQGQQGDWWEVFDRVGQALDARLSQAA